MRCRKKASDYDFSSPGPKASGEGVTGNWWIPQVTQINNGMVKTDRQ